MQATFKKPSLILVDETLTIHRPIAEAFAFLSNHENYARWFPDVISITSGNDLPHGSVGKIYSETIKLPTGRTRDITIKVVESQPPVAFTTEGNLSLLYPRMEIRLSEKSARECSLHLKFLSRNQSALGRLAVRALVKKSLARQFARGLKRLKDMLDKGAN